jgi:hypothetical protein
MSITTTTTTLKTNPALLTNDTIGNIQGLTFKSNYPSVDALQVLVENFTNDLYVRPNFEPTGNSSGVIMRVKRDLLLGAYDLMLSSTFGSSSILDQAVQLLLRLQNLPGQWIPFSRLEWATLRRALDELSENVRDAGVNLNSSSVLLSPIDSSYRARPSPIVNDSTVRFIESSQHTELSNMLLDLQGIIGKLDTSTAYTSAISMSSRHLGLNGSTSAPYVCGDSDPFRSSVITSATLPTKMKERFERVVDEYIEAFTPETLLSSASDNYLILAKLTYDVDETGTVVDDTVVTDLEFSDFDVSSPLYKLPWVMTASSSNSEVAAKIAFPNIITTKYTGITVFGSTLVDDDKDNIVLTSKINNRVYSFDDLAKLILSLNHLEEAWSKLVSNSADLFAVWRIGSVFAQDLIRSMGMPVAQADLIVNEGIGVLAITASEIAAAASLPFTNVYELLLVRFYWVVLPKALNIGLTKIINKSLSNTTVQRQTDKLVTSSLNFLPTFTDTIL